MKNIMLCLVLMLIFVPFAHANIYVYSEKTTNKVLFIVEKDTVILSDSDKVNIKRTVLLKDLEFYALDEAYTDYKLSGKKFILNTSEISKRENEKVAAKDKKNKKDGDFQSAKDKLMSATWIPLNSDEVDSLK